MLISARNSCSEQPWLGGLMSSDDSFYSCCADVTLLSRRHPRLFYNADVSTLAYDAGWSYSSGRAGKLVVARPRVELDFSFYCGIGLLMVLDVPVLSPSIVLAAFLRFLDEGEQPSFLGPSREVHPQEICDSRRPSVYAPPICFMGRDDAPFWAPEAAAFLSATREADELSLCSRKPCESSESSSLRRSRI